jgi:N-acetylmuramoyl-L-alanine amidase
MRYGLLIILGMLCGLLWANEKTVQIMFGSQPIPMQPAPVWEENECWLPVVHAEQLKLELELVQGAQFALIKNPALPPDAKDRVAVRMLQLQDENGKSVNIPCVPLRQLILIAGGASSWSAESRTLTIRARLKHVELLADRVVIHTALPTLPSVSTLQGPDRLVIDLPGCQLPETPLQSTGNSERVQAVRFGQFDPNTARVVLDLKAPMPVVVWSGEMRQEHRIPLTPNTPPEIETQSDEPKDDEPQPAPLPTTAKVKPFEPPTIEKTTQGLTVRLPAPQSAKPRVNFLENPLRVVVDVPGTLEENLEQIFDDPESLLTAVRAIPLEGGMVRVVLELTRALGVNVLNRRNELAVVLNVPRGAGGSLKQKIITIDPGHGGGQPGTRITKNGKTYYEKEITLKIGSMAAERLSKTGASVLMTRAEDVQVGLYERTQMSNQSNAHFFVSIHCDSNSKPNSASGTTIYYHGDNADSRALAQAILNEIVQVSGLPTKGVRTDKTLYQTGLAVLRTSDMPAVLIEVGYLNHDSDRAKLVDPGFQARIADAIVRGIQKYVEGK